MVMPAVTRKTQKYSKGLYFLPLCVCVCVYIWVCEWMCGDRHLEIRVISPLIFYTHTHTQPYRINTPNNITGTILQLLPKAWVGYDTYFNASFEKSIARI